MSAISLHTGREKIQSYLSKICSSKEFSSKEKICLLFKFLVEETLAGRSDQLKQYTIATAILDRPPDFNPDLDPIVRILAGRLRRSLKSYYEQEGRDDAIRIVIPRGGYVPVFIGKDAGDRDTDQNIAFLPEIPDIVRPAIVVHPLQNLTGDAEQDYFARGFTQELIIELARYEDFQIIFAREYPEQTAPDNHDGHRQPGNARLMIKGSVRKAETTIKIAIQLFDPLTGEHMWGEQYSRNLTADNLLQIQEQIVYDIITNIAGEFGIIPRNLYRQAKQKAQPDLHTCDAIFRFYHYQTELSPETYLAAFNALEQAVARNPDCGIACAMLADLYMNTFAHDLPGGDDGLDRAEGLVRSAIRSEPDNQLVRLSSAVYYFHMNQRDLSLQELNKALALNPGSPLRLGGVGFFLALNGEWEKGRKLLEKAIKMNHNYPAWYHGVTTLYHYRTNDYLRASEEAAKYDLPGFFWTPLLRAACLGQLKHTEAARREIDRLLELKPDFRGREKILIQRYVKEDALADHVLEGLQKAGLEVE